MSDVALWVYFGVKYWNADQVYRFFTDFSLGSSTFEQMSGNATASLGVEYYLPCWTDIRTALVRCFMIPSRVLDAPGRALFSILIGIGSWEQFNNKPLNCL